MKAGFDVARRPWSSSISARMEGAAHTAATGRSSFMRRAISCLTAGTALRLGVPGIPPGRRTRA